MQIYRNLDVALNNEQARGNSGSSLKKKKLHNHEMEWKRNLARN